MNLDDKIIYKFTVKYGSYIILKKEFPDRDIIKQVLSAHLTKPYYYQAELLKIWSRQCIGEPSLKVEDL